MIGFIADLGGLFDEIQKFRKNDRFCVTDTRVLEGDLIEGQKIFVFFCIGYCLSVLCTECSALILLSFNYFNILARTHSATLVQ